MTKPNARGGQAGGILTRKLGPLPTWAWMGVGLVAALILRSALGRNGSTSGSSGPAAAVGQSKPSQFAARQDPSVNAPGGTTVVSGSYNINSGNVSTVAPAPQAQIPAPAHPDAPVLPPPVPAKDTTVRREPRRPAPRPTRGHVDRDQDHDREHSGGRR